jgi:hypothetical protein
VRGRLLEAGQPVPQLHHAGRQRLQQRALQVGAVHGQVVVAQALGKARGIGPVEHPAVLS